MGAVWNLVEVGFVGQGIAVHEFVVDILLSGDKCGFGKFFVITRNFDLLAVFRNLFEVVVERGELLELTFKVVLHFGGNLIGAFGNDADSFVDIACVSREFDHVAGDSVEGSVSLLVIHFKKILEGLC